MNNIFKAGLIAATITLCGCSDFLELERTLLSHRSAHATADEHGTASILAGIGCLLDAALIFEDDLCLSSGFGKL